MMKTILTGMVLMFLSFGAQAGLDRPKPMIVDPPPTLHEFYQDYYEKLFDYSVWSFWDCKSTHHEGPYVFEIDLREIWKDERKADKLLDLFRQNLRKAPPEPVKIVFPDGSWERWIFGEIG